MKDIDYIRNLLLDYNYSCELRKNGIDCYSKDGIEDGEVWFDVFNAIKKYFGHRFFEVYHHVCTNHIKFTIFYKNE